MIVKMNDIEFDIFEGARVKDVLLKYSEDDYKTALLGECYITDKNNNPLDLSGAVTEGQHLFLSKEEEGDK